MLPLSSPPATTDVICLSHLRWNFVFQRPQHLMTRCARERRVFFVEEPIIEQAGEPRLVVDAAAPVRIVVPHLPAGLADHEQETAQRALIDELIRSQHIDEYLLWYYTPMALAFTDHLAPVAVVYDCMDELSAFKGAPAQVTTRETELMRRAALVLTGGHSLYEAKRSLHANIHAVPSSVDVAHFAQARRQSHEPSDQASIGHPRLGFFGVIDERMDLALVDDVAGLRPEWQVIMLGPVAKIDPASLPRRANIHYLGARPYAGLPRYLAGWDVAIMPFARNDATRFISPTKTPEYLAAGKPVVSTSIRDVVRPYGTEGLVRIADTPDAFVSACEAAMAEDPAARVTHVDAFLRQTSWDATWRRVKARMEEALAGSPLEQTDGVSEYRATLPASI